MLHAHALSALDADDARALSQHLAECDECRRELADWESTASSLALGANPVEPSPLVRDRIISAVRNEKRASNVIPIPQQSRRGAWASFGQVGAIAASIACLVLFLWIIVLHQQNRSLRRQIDFMSSEIRSTQQEARRANEFVNILSSPGAKVAELQGSGQGEGATAQFVYDRSGRAMLMANNLPPAPAGKEYQLWFIVGKNPPIPGGTFAPDDVGRGELMDQVPDVALDSAVFAVTLEQAGGATAPTSSIYLRSGL